MYTRHYTSIDESKKLLSLGLKAESADMLYTWDTDNKTYYPLPIVDDKEHDFPNGLPCWSVGALLEVLPMVNGREPHLIWTKVTYTCFYYAGYEVTKETMIEAVYNMTVWLLENDYIKKNNYGKDNKRNDAKSFLGD